jgi:nucleolar protein 53
VSLSSQALQKQLQDAQAATAERAARRAAARAERAATEPSRLGKRRFSAAPIAVALSEELHGSMRRVVPVATLLSDRYVALQRDEKIEPRVAARYVRSKSYMLYEPGSRGTKELEMHAETQALRRKSKEATKAAAKAAAKESSGAAGV